MQSASNHQRLKSINKMLLEMATGNHRYRVESSGCDNDLNEIASMLNAVAEKMQQYNRIHKPTEQSDSELIPKVIDFIKSHIEEPLPTTKELAKMFGTNEFTLKECFRNRLKTSIYQFYNTERLKKAHFLIQQTTIPLKEIAFLCGFNDYTNFYKAFRKKYNYPPSDLNRINTTE